MKMKGIIFVLSTFVVAFVSFIFWYRWDSATNHGYTFGYYGDYNTVSNALAGIPGVTIVATGYNADVTLEEFGFDVKTKDGRVLKIWFNELDPIRKMTGAKLKSAITNKINGVARTPID